MKIIFFFVLLKIEPEKLTTFRGLGRNINNKNFDNLGSKGRQKQILTDH